MIVPKITKVFTIGVYGSTRAAFFDALETAEIDILLDIRRRRAVRGSQYTFANAQRLTDELAARGIEYRHILGLAPDKETLAIQGDADTEANRLKSERTELAPAYVKQYVAGTLSRFDFATLVSELHGFAAPVILCIERIPEACHRSLVAPKLAQALGTDEIVHLIPESAAFEALRVLRQVRRKRSGLRKRYG
ncbi:MAG: DUF488 family protein [Vulcanimicrobiaceae bacterium]